jgi:hypothetical protein
MSENKLSVWVFQAGRVEGACTAHTRGDCARPSRVAGPAAVPRWSSRSTRTLRQRGAISTTLRVRFHTKFRAAWGRTADYDAAIASAARNAIVALISPPT